MTIVVNRGTEGARTHALIAGVGYYEHLPGGANPDSELDNWCLEQLTSPPYSAKAIADWLITAHKNPDAPLGTVEMLLSPGQEYKIPNSLRRQEVQAATMANFRAAYEGWRDRCNTNPDNVAILYFSGHGLSNPAVLIMMEDFRSDQFEGLVNIVNIDTTHWASATTCQAHAQCFFIDACRQVSYDAIIVPDVGETIGNVNIEKGEVLSWPRFYATQPTEAAYSEKTEASFFTQALLAALNGISSKQIRGEWFVTTDVLQSGIIDAMKRLERDPSISEQKPQLGGRDTGGSVINVLGPPDVPAVIGLGPPQASKINSFLEITSEDDPSIHKDRRNAAGDWKLNLITGRYKGTASFPGDEYPETHHQMFVGPHMLDHLWDVENPNG